MFYLDYELPFFQENWDMLSLSLMHMALTTHSEILGNMLKYGILIGDQMIIGHDLNFTLGEGEN